MKINFDIADSVIFNAKVSPKFVNAMRGCINNGQNRLKNNYRLNSQLERIDKFGFNNYSIELVQKHAGAGSEYYMLALRDGDEIENGIILSKKYTFRKAMERFLNLNKGDFKNQLKKGRKFSSVN